MRSLSSHRLGGEAEPPQKLAQAMKLLAKLGGDLARTLDPPPGTMVVWRGLIRLTDIGLGFQMKRQLVGN